MERYFLNISIILKKETIRDIITKLSLELPCQGNKSICLIRNDLIISNDIFLYDLGYKPAEIVNYDLLDRKLEVDYHESQRILLKFKASQLGDYLEVEVDKKLTLSTIISDLLSGKKLKVPHKCQDSINIVFDGEYLSKELPIEELNLDFGSCLDIF